MVRIRITTKTTITAAATQPSAIVLPVPKVVEAGRSVRGVGIVVPVSVEPGIGAIGGSCVPESTEPDGGSVP